MHLRAHYQNAYVTHDLDQAIALVERRYGAKGFFPVEVDVDVTTPRGPEKISMRLAYVWIGALNLELIQPLSGCVNHYRASLPWDRKDYRPQFNHIAMRRENLDEMRAEIKRMGLPVLFEGSMHGLHFIYADARSELGHLLEYVWATPEVWKRLGWPT